jgi:hypothetical protein
MNKCALTPPKVEIRSEQFCFLQREALEFSRRVMISSHGGICLTQKNSAAQKQNKRKNVICGQIAVPSVARHLGRKAPTR